MFVIQKSTISRNGLGETFRDKTYANASFYVQDLNRDGGRSKAKTYVLWMSGDAVNEKRCGVTKFDSADDAQRVLDRYPFAFGKGCKVVTVEDALADADLYRRWTSNPQSFSVNPFQVTFRQSNQV